MKYRVELRLFGRVDTNGRLYSAERAEAYAVNLRAACVRMRSPALVVIVAELRLNS